MAAKGKAKGRASKSKPAKAKVAKSKPAQLPVQKAIGTADFQSLLRNVKEKAGRIREQSGSLRSAIGIAVKDKNLEKRAFAIYRTLEALGDHRLSMTLKALLYYIDIGKLQQRADRQLEAFTQAQMNRPPELKSTRKKKNGAADIDPTTIPPAPVPMFDDPLPVSNPQHLLDAADELERKGAPH